MNPIKLIFYFTAVIFMSACSSGGGQRTSSNAAQGGKDLFSLWDGGGSSLNLSNAHFGSATVVYWVNQTTGATCETTMTINGSESSGTASITTSRWSGGGHGDPGCSSLINSYSYSNDGTHLNVCAQGCEEFQ